MMPYFKFFIDNSLNYELVRPILGIISSKKKKNIHTKTYTHSLLPHFFFFIFLKKTSLQIRTHGGLSQKALSL